MSLELIHGKYTENGYFFMEEYHPAGYDGPSGYRGLSGSAVKIKNAGI